MRKKVALSITLSEEVVERLTKEAKNVAMNKSNYIEYVLRKWFEMEPKGIFKDIEE